MIYPNNLGIKEQEIYTFAEVSEYLVNQTSSGSYEGYAFDSYALNELLSQVLGILQSGDNVFSLTFLAYVEPNWVFTDLAIKIMNKLSARYYSHYCVTLEHDSEKDTKFREFFRKVLNKLDYTYEKYERIIYFYDEEKTHLLDRLSRSRSGTRDVSQEGEHEDLTNTTGIFNDTPQTTDVVATIEGNQYVTELNKSRVGSEGSSSSSGSDEFEENELFDTMTIMQKLDEIQKLYAKTWENWVNEFDELFVEEVNY